jgi:hypothetical protein
VSHEFASRQIHPPRNSGGPSVFVSAGGGALPNFTNGEIPSGLINGSNTIFTLSAAPSPASSLQLFLNGVLQIQGIDYTLLGQSITFTNPPVSGATLRAWYTH